MKTFLHSLKAIKIKKVERFLILLLTLSGMTGVLKTNAQCFTPVTFNVTTNLTINNGSQLGATADFNGDGIPDLAVPNSVLSYITIMLGTGAGTFGYGYSVEAGNNPVSVAAGDFNGDGKMDIAVVNQGGQNVTVFLGNGNGSFAATASATLSVGSTPTCITTADFNGDNKLDLAISCYGSGNVYIFTGNGNGTFNAASPATMSVGSNPRFVISADVNGDGNLDLLTANQGGGNISILTGNGNGTFAVATNISTGSSPYGIAIGDYNGDGKPDLAVANSGNNNVAVLLNTGTFSSPYALSFGTSSTFSVGSAPQSIVTADFNNDGKLDVATCNNSSNNVSVILGTGTGSFGAAANFPVGSTPYSLVTADFNLDGRPDLATINSASLLINTTTTASAAASTPVCMSGGNGTLSLTGGPSGAASYAWLGPNGFTSSSQNTSIASPTSAAAGVYTLTVVTGGGCTGTAKTPSVAIYSVPAPFNQTVTACGSYTVGSTTHTSSGTYTDVTTTVHGCDSTVITNLTITPASTVTNNDNLCAGQSVTVGTHTYKTTGLYKDKFTAVSGCDSTIFSNVKVFFGIGSTPTFKPFTAVTGNSTEIGTVGDFNNDGIPDLVWSSSGNVYVFLGNGDGTFGSGISTPAGSGGVAVVVADFNNDGKPDVAVIGGSAYILLGNGNGTFGGVVATLPLGSSPTAGISGDFNGDGKADLAVVNYNSHDAYIYLGNGNGTFTAASVPTVALNAFQPRSITTADINGDGKLDLVTADSYSSTSKVSVLLGDGAGGFKVNTFTAGSSPYWVAVADYNGDGFPDLAVANQGSGNVSILLGNGNGGFGTATNYPVGSGPQSIVAADFNGDGILDLATCNDNSGNGTTISVLVGTGTGSFSSATNFTVGKDPYSLATGDFNGDGKPDLVTFNWTGGGNNNSSVLINAAGSPSAGATSPVCTSGSNSTLSLTGSPSGLSGYSWTGPNGFTSSSQSPSIINPTTAAAGVYSLSTTDGHSCPAASMVTVVVNSPVTTNQTITACGSYTVGSTTYTSSGVYNTVLTSSKGCDSTVITNLTINSVSSTTQNVNICAGQSLTIGSHTYKSSGTYVNHFTGANGCDSAVITNLKVVFGNGGSPSFTITENMTSNNNTQNGTLGDFNGDGFPDLAVPTNVSGDVSILLSNGAGGFGAAINTATGSFPVSVAAGDFDGDGKLDMASCNSSGNNVTVFLGNGNGTFGAVVATLPVGSTPTMVTTADLNGDGKLDLAISCYSSNNVYIFLGNGNGTFAAASPATMTVGSNPRFVTSADVNGDGKLDLITANQSGGNISILLGNGNGTFVTANNISTGSAPYWVSIADYNGDGKPDLAVANSGNGNVAVFLNTGTFSSPYALSLGSSTTFPVGSGPQSVVAADFNGDGILDLATANNSASTVSVLLGTGTGSFGSQSTFSVGSTPYSIATGDFNGDGRPDLATFNAASVLINNALAPTAVATTPVCTSGTNSTLNLTGGPSGLSGYLWTGPNSYSSSSQSLVISSPTTVAAGIYTLAITDSHGCTYTATTPTVSVNSPVVTNQTVEACGSYTVGSTTHTSTGNYVDVLTSSKGCDSTVNTNLTIKGVSKIIQNLSICPGQSVTVGSNIYKNSGTYIDHFTAADGCDSMITTNLKVFFGTGGVPTFNPYTTVTGGASQIGVTGDFNNDGKPDLAWITNNIIDVFLGTGTGTFGSANTTSTGSGGATAVAAADFNGDGKLDIATANEGSASVFILLGNGNGTFGSIVSTLPVGSTPTCATTGDFNGDGKMDIAVCNYSSNTVSIYLGNGNGTFTASATNNITVGSSPRFITSADLNGDGYPDLITANQNGGNISILLGTGTGTFSTTATNLSSGSQSYGIAIGDYNGDGKPDLAVAREVGSGNVIVYLNTGTFSSPYTLSFGSSTSFNVNSGPQSIVTADFNGDGIIDLATSNDNNGSGNTVSILLGNGSGSFSSLTNFSVANDPYSISTADFNLDGKPDLATLHWTGAGNSSILLNTMSLATASAVTPVCTSGSNNTLTLIGGASGLVSYSWVGPNGYSNSIQNPVISNPTTASAGVYMLNVTDSHGCTASASTASVVVNSPVTFTQIISACGSYTVGSTTHTSSGTFNDVLTSSKGCDSTVITNLTIKPLAFITQNLTRCAGQSVTVGSRTYTSTGTYIDKFTGGAANGCDSTVTTKLKIMFGSGGASSFASVATVTSGATQQGAVGDFNNDGKPDLAIISSNTIYVYPGTGTGTFGTAVTTNVGSGGAVQIVPGDFNGDGKLDVATINQSSGNVYIMLGNGNGTFGTSIIATLSVGGTPTTGVAADFNGDGKLDLAVSNYGPSTVSIYLGNGNGTFTASSTNNISVGGSPRFIAAADLNGDGLLDLITANENGGNISIMLATGTGTTFGTATAFASGSGSYGIAIGDYNGDGKPDVAVVKNANSNNVAVYLNTGTFVSPYALSLGTVANYTVGSGPLSIITGDFNGDGNLDLATSNPNGYSFNGTTVSVLPGTGTGTFGAVSTFTVGTNPYSIKTADFNLDGKPDIATYSNNSNISVLINNEATNPPTPTANATPNPLCPNLTLGLVGGPSAMMAYQWSGPGGYTSSLQSPNVPGVTSAASGVYSLVVTDSRNCTGIASTPSVVVNTPPAITVNPQSVVCSGEVNAVLTAAGGSTYVWAPSANLTPSAGTSATETAQISLLTFYTVTGTDANGCTANQVVPVATVATGGAISPAFSIICSGGTTTLTVSGAAGHDYQWQISPDNVNWNNITGATNTTYTTASGDGNSVKFYRLMAQSNTCWNVASTTAEVDVSNTVIVVSATNITDNSLTLNWNPTGTGNYSISYSGPSSATSTSVTPPKTITGLTSDGTYSVTVTQTGISGCPASGTVTGVTTLCAMPTGVTLSSPAPSQIQVSWTGTPGADYRVYYRPLFSYTTYFTKDVSNASSVLLTKQGNNNIYASTTYEVYVSRLDCPTTGVVGQGTNPTNVTTLPTVSCTTPVIDSVRSLCPVQIEVFIHDNGVNQYNVYIQRITPSVLAVNSYGVSGTYFTINTPYSGDQYLIAVDARCGGALSTLYIYPGNVTVKPLCDAPTNLVLSNPTCHGFTASWNSDPCLSNSASAYDFYLRVAGTINYNSYGVPLPGNGIGPHELLNFLAAGRTYQVFVRSVYNCNGFVTYGPTSQVETTTTLSSGCRDEDAEQPQENKPAAQQYSPDNGEVFSLYPNPNTGKFIVDLSRLSNNEDAVRIEVINMLGQTVMTQLTAISDGHMSEYINLPGGTAAGTYIVRLTAGKNVYTAKINISK